MPRQEHVLSVFVASPSDVGNEREKLEEIISEFNVTWSREFGIYLDLIRWETHAYPGMGADAQAVINKQIKEDYDIFIGIMWCRYGTPTNRSGSGTVEEFERAKARYDADPSSINLMVYFKDEPVSPSQLDPKQLEKVAEFRHSLGDEGVLYWEFKSLNNFEQLVRLHLNRQIQEWNSRLKDASNNVNGIVEKSASSIAQEEIEVSEDDLGIIDFAEILEYRFMELKDITERIGEATEGLTEKMNERTAEMNMLPRNSEGNVNRKSAKRLISRAATDMNQYTEKIEAELPLFSNALNTGMNALIKLTALSVDLDTDETTIEQAREELQEVVTLHDLLSTAQESIRQFREVMDKLPRMTSELNKAKRGVAFVLDKLLNEFNSGQILLREAEATVQDFLERAAAPSKNLPTTEILEDEIQWDETFARSPDLLAKLASAAMAEHRAGKTQELDPDTL